MRRKKQWSQARSETWRSHAAMIQIAGASAADFRFPPAPQCLVQGVGTRQRDAQKTPVQLSNPSFSLRLSVFVVSGRLVDSCIPANRTQSSCERSFALVASGPAAGSMTRYLYEESHDHYRIRDGLMQANVAGRSQPSTTCTRLQRDILFSPGLACDAYPHVSATVVLLGVSTLLRDQPVQPFRVATWSPVQLSCRGTLADFYRGDPSPGLYDCQSCRSLIR